MSLVYAEYSRGESGALNSCSDKTSSRLSAFVFESETPNADISVNDMNKTIWYFERVELINKVRVPYPIEGLSYVKEDSYGFLFRFKALRDIFNCTEDLLRT
ncbi:hypothetical protein EVAR_47874_1 [Eumeta japonica]|uniref:Uncharacterized protein n=1 Tax=Eumeta variegata TaxID=151549 RepID=A0A4C1ZX96_EUMVA|nr:hypothetical protein EVAR_47874_1 [Eumeta japonica]